MTTQNIVIGQRWWVKLPGNLALTEVRIGDLTAKTVDLWTVTVSYNSDAYSLGRFLIRDVELIERTK